MTLTFVDAGVLIAAARGRGEIHRRALRILGDPKRSFATSDFLWIEVLPNAIYYKRLDEVDFYEEYFGSVSRWSHDPASVVTRARQEAVRYGLSAMDAIHVAAASILGAEELVTTERPTKPMHRTPTIAIRTLHGDWGE